MATESLVQPIEAAPAPEVVPTEAPPPETGAEWPQALVESPVMQALIAGSPGAVSGSIKAFSTRPEAKILTQHKDLIAQAGMGFYRSLDGDTGVIFNQRFVNGEQVKQADSAGQLASIAPPFDTVESEVSKSGLKHPSIQPGGQPTGLAGAPQPMAGASPAPAPLGASAQRKALTAQISNLQPGSPTSGPQPGAGRLLNNILKPVL